MVKYKIVFTKKAAKDAPLLNAAGLKQNAIDILNILEINPFQNPPSYEKLKGDLAGAYSRRLNIQHRIVYQVFEEKKTVKILRMWTHYE